MAIARILGAPFRAAQQLMGGLADRLEGRPRPETGRTPRPYRDGPPTARPLSELVRDLRHRRAATRVRAAAEIARRRLDGAASELVVATRDRNREARRAALAALWWVDPGRFAEAAVALSGQLSQEELFGDLDSIVEAAASASASGRPSYPFGEGTDGTH